MVPGFLLDRTSARDEALPFPHVREALSAMPDDVAALGGSSAHRRRPDRDRRPGDAATARAAGGLRPGPLRRSAADDVATSFRWPFARCAMPA